MPRAFETAIHRIGKSGDRIMYPTVTKTNRIGSKTRIPSKIQIGMNTILSRFTNNRMHRPKFS